MPLPVLPALSRAQLVLGAALGLFALGFWAGWESRAPQPIPPEVRAHEQAAQALDQEAQARRPLLEEARRETRRLEARVAEALDTVPLPGVVASVDLAQPEHDPALLDLVDRLEGLTRAQAHQITLLEAQLADAEGANAHRAQALALVVPQDRPRPWAVGAVVFPPQQGHPRELEAFAHRALGPVLLGVSVAHSPLAGTRAGVIVGWRY